MFQDELELADDPEVPDTCLAVLIDQYIALYAPNINMRIHSFLRPAYRGYVAMQDTQPMKVHQAVGCLCKLLRV